MENFYVFNYCTKDRPLAAAGETGKKAHTPLKLWVKKSEKRIALVPMTLQITLKSAKSPFLLRCWERERRGVCCITPAAAFGKG